MNTKAWIFLGILLGANSAYGACLYTNTVDVPPVHINASNTRFAHMMMSNNSDSSIDVNLKLYDQNGNDVTAAVESGGGVATIVPNGTARFFYTETVRLAPCGES